METNALLETHLRQLRLPTFKQNYASFAEDAARSNHDHVRYLLALAACRQGLKVRFWTAAGLVNELLQAQSELRLHRFIAAALKLKLVVLDELGFIPFAANEAQVLFTFCSELYERVAMIVTTNLKFADWTQVFGEEKLTAALLDRLTHHAHILELVGESYRFRQRMARKQREEACRNRGWVHFRRANGRVFDDHNRDSIARGGDIFDDQMGAFSIDTNTEA